METQIQTQTTLCTDSFGFILHDNEVMQAISYLKYPKRAIYKRMARGGGRYNCKSLCRNIPKANSRRVSYSKTGEYFCATCEIAMRCVRCRCCGRAGRVEPRGRHRRLDRAGVKYIE